MYAFILSLATLLSLVSAHSVIVGVYGDTKADLAGFNAVEAIARNCTLISPCQQDSPIMREVEMKANISSWCGRTELNGTVDIDSNTEQALADGRVAKVTSGSTLTVTVHQVNQDGAGPYTCEVKSSNSTNTSTSLVVTNNVPGSNGLSLAKFEQFNMTVQLPSNLDCTGGSTGNICTVRCRNNALAGPFGGCFAVQQTD